ncbi:MAG TPA: response regulator [Thermoanaerobaculia bacterium]|nr:response regulator [Thermoanaerobaculia bacterium]
MAARTVLLVDDDPLIGETLRELLPWREVKLESTANADEAIDCLEQHSYCGVVLNLELANGGGRRILRHLADLHTGVPVVLISSSIPEWLRDLPNVDDIKLVMTPPFEPSLLASMILGLCGVER